MQLTTPRIQGLSQYLESRDDLVTAILYGSQAAGTAGAVSDVDLAVAGAVLLDSERMIDLSLELERRLNLTVQVRDLRRTGGLFLNQILTKGQILVSKDVLFLTQLITQNLDFMTDVYPAYYTESLRQNREYFGG